MKEKRLRSLVALGVLPLALVACGSATGDKPSTPIGNNPGAAGGSSVPNGTAGGSSVPGGGGAPAGDPLPPAEKCVPGIPATTQIPMMLNRQYANVVRDLLGVTDVGGQQVTDLLVGDAGSMTSPAWKVYND